MSQAPGYEIWLFFLVVLAIGGVFLYSLRLKQKQPQRDAYMEALEFIAEGKDAKAIQKLKEAVRQDSENVRAYKKLGDLLRKRGMTKHAIRIHKDLTLRGSLTPEQRQDVYYSLLLDYKQAGEVGPAIDLGKKLLAMGGTNKQAIAQELITLMEKAERWKDALELSEKYFRQSDEHKKRRALYQVFLGLQLQEQGKGKDARIQFKEGLKSDSHCAAAYYYIGKSYVLEDRLEDAIKVWTDLCFNIPSRAYIVFPELEKACFDTGAFTEVESIYGKMLEKDPTNVSAALALAEIYLKKSEYDAALDILKRLEEEVGENPQLEAFATRVLYNRGQYKAAAQKAVHFLEKQFHWNQKQYTCKQCGYKSSEPLWLCPQCRSLDSFIP